MDANTPAYIFIEKLFQFCLEKRGIAWQPAPRNSHAEVSDALFNQNIGNKVIHMTSIFQSRVHAISKTVWDYINESSDHAKFSLLGQEIFAVAYEIFNNLQNVIVNTYVFLAVMVEVSVQCANNGKPSLIQDCFVCIIPNVLNSRIPNGFLNEFNRFAMYAENQISEDNSDE